MARNEEKAQSMLNRYISSAVGFNVTNTGRLEADV